MPNDEASTGAEQAKAIFSGSPDQIAHAVGWDTQRIWATGVQAFRADDHVLFVFRDQLLVKPDGGEIVQKNVASIVMPVKTAIEFGKLFAQLGLNETVDPS